MFLLTVPENLTIKPDPLRSFVQSGYARRLENWPTAIFRTSAPLPPPKSVVFAGWAMPRLAHRKSNRLPGAIV
jgi:hypothetical protein